MTTRYVSLVGAGACFAPPPAPNRPPGTRGLHTHSTVNCCVRTLVAQVNIGGAFYEVSGTSASAPVFAGIVALINAARLAANKSPVGFMNPLLYQLFESDPSLFHDITSGNNKCTADATVCCEYGFNSRIGWDPVTGLGSIHSVQKLIDAIAQV
jgi:hypothetical protein